MRFQSALHRSESLPALSATLLGGLLGARGGTSGESWPLKPQFRPYRNAHLHISYAAQRPADRPANGRRFDPFSATMPCFTHPRHVAPTMVGGADSARSG